MEHRFYKDLREIEEKRDHILFEENTGLSPEALEAACSELAAQENRSKFLLKAELLEFLFDHARLELTPAALFADRIDHNNIIQKIRKQWKTAAYAVCAPLLAETAPADRLGAYSGYDDFGHTCPDWRSLLKLGLPGIVRRAEEALALHPASDFFRSVILTYKAIIRLALRFADAAEALGADGMAENLRRVACRAPESLYEAIQLILLIYRLQTEVEGENVRSIGRLDVLLAPYAEKDDEDTKELLRYFFCRCYDKSVDANIPFTLCGEDVLNDGSVTHMALMMVDVLGELNNPSPKVQLRIPAPDAVITNVLKLIRRGSNSFVFCNDGIVEAALMKCGHTEADARDYVMIGCYESSTMGRENACTCNGRVSLPKAVECALNNGCDLRTGERIGPETAADFPAFDDLVSEVLHQAAYFAKRSMERTTAMERQYSEVNPSPILSGSMPDCINSGKDVYEGGTKYNFSSVNVFGTATAADALLAVKKLVYEEKRLTLHELKKILADNWKDHEDLRLYCKGKLPKYGCGDAKADALAARLLDSTADVINGTPNGRGGCFRAGAFSINWRTEYGERCAASADGRHDGETLSKNMCACEGADREGVTAHILSATAFDYTRLPNGTVLDLVLHESAVKGDDGLTAMRGLLNVFMGRGGLAVQFNVLSPETLIDAQKNPEKYATLQVRLCGWNVLFVDLSKEEQDEFIRSASAD